jgi:hypothetical protein
MSFEMRVVDAFRFQDGRTVLVGPVVGDENMIGPGRCELIAGNTRQAIVSVEGEMIPSGMNVRRDYRAVSTRETLQLDPDQLARGSYRLVRSTASA